MLEGKKRRSEEKTYAAESESDMAQILELLDREFKITMIKTGKI